MAYAGSGPYCYANSLAMALGEFAPPPGVIEVLTGSPFGFELLGGTLPLFNPLGWTPEVGLDAAIELLGWTCQRSEGDGALHRLTSALADAASGDDHASRTAAGRGVRPVLAGPLDMGLLLYQPGTPAAFGDHYVAVLAVEDGVVLLHDPHGHPYATLPMEEFLAAWRGAGVFYIDIGWVLRTGFARSNLVADADALRRSLPGAAGWLAGRRDLGVPGGSLGGREGMERFADQVEAGLLSEIRAHLAHFAIRVGARRLADAAACLASLKLSAAAAIATDQARLVGSLQYPVVIGDDKTTARTLRRLAPTYERLAEALG